MVIDRGRLLSTFLELVQIDSPSGQEQTISAHLAARLRALDMDVVVDEIGNVLGRWEAAGEYLMLSAHLDTVVPGTGIRPVVKDGVIHSDGTTILGGDDKSGVAVILEVLTRLHEDERRPAVKVAFSVGEEIGLLGAKAAGSLPCRSALECSPFTRLKSALPCRPWFAVPSWFGVCWAHSVKRLRSVTGEFA